MKQKITLVIILVIGILSLLIAGCQEQKENTQIANPASTNCIKNGGELKMVSGENGQYGLCKFEDGSMCEEWAFFRNECTKGNIFEDLTNCESYFDGCNTCTIIDGKLGSCTKKACNHNNLETPKCLKLKS